MSTLRAVATRGSNANSIAAGPNSANCLTGHWARQELSSGAWYVEYPNWYSSAGNADAGSGGTISIKLGVEYPAGVVTPVTFGGSNTGSIADGAELVSDAILVNVPRGEKFFLRPHVVNSVNAIVFTPLGLGDVGYYFDQPNGDALEYGTNLPDKSTSGTIGGSGFTQGVYLPSAIIALSDEPAIGIAADSRGRGIQDSFANGRFSDIGEFERRIGPKFGYINVSVPSESAANFASPNRNKSKSLLARYCSHGVANWGNDLSSGTSAAAVFAHHVTIQGQMPRVMMTPATVAPVTTSSAIPPNWNSYGVQSIANVTQNAEREDLNARFRTNQQFNGCWDVAYVVEGQGADAGLWAPGCSGDGVHEQQGGCVRIANAREVPIDFFMN